MKINQENDHKSKQNGVDSQSRTMSTISEMLSIQSHERAETRLIHHWTGVVPSSEEWELESGIGLVVASSLRNFFSDNMLMVCLETGLAGSAPRFRTVEFDGVVAQSPREVLFFLEDEQSKERFVIQVEVDHSRDYVFKVYSAIASVWLQRFQQHVRQKNHLKGSVFDLQARQVRLANVKLDDVVLTVRQNEVINRHVLGYARQINEMISRGARGQRGVLLEGVPGCGKSLLVNAIANELSGISICIAGPDQISRYGSVDSLQELVRMTAPCVVILEEIDIFGADRRRGGGVGMAELMQLMDGLRSIPGVLWLATTNRPEVVEGALADRPGRFDRRVEFGPLPLPERRRLMSQLVKPQSITDDALDLATSLTDGMTGAQMRELAETLRILCQADFYGVLEVERAWEDCGFEEVISFGFQSK